METSREGRVVSCNCSSGCSGSTGTQVFRISWQVSHNKKRFDLRYSRGSFGRGGLLEDRVPADVHPIVLLGWHVTQLAVGLVVRRHVASRLLRLEQGPTPAVAPQVV